MIRSSFAVAMGVVGAALLTTALAAPAKAEEPRRGGILNFAVGAEPPNYDCHANTSFAFTHPVRPHYNTLLRFVPDNYPQVEGDLAESWEVSDDGLTYTFHLRQGVQFHDGSPFTSEDVRATYDRLRNPPDGVVSIRQASLCRHRVHRDAGRSYGHLQAVGTERRHAVELRLPLGLHL